MEKFLITKSNSQEFQFNLYASNGQIILKSQSYASKVDCTNWINKIKNNAALDSRYDRKISKDGELYFNLKAGNELIIGTSQMYSSIYARENGILSVKKIAPDAKIIAETI